MIHSQGLGSISLAPSTPQIKMFGNQESGRPKYGEWQMPNNTAELQYLNRRIQDLELDKTDQRKKIDNLETELVVLNKKYAVLEIEHKSVEAKHKYELDNVVSQHNAQKVSGLNGFVDQVGKVLDKVTSNDKITDMIAMGLAAKYGGGIMPMAQQTPPANQQMDGMQHPHINDAAIGGKIQEIYQMLKGVPAEQIPSLHVLFTVFLKFKSKNLIGSVEQSTIEFLQTMQNQQNQQNQQT